MARHDVERVLGDDARRDLQDETADFLADRDVVRLHAVQDALAGGGVGDILAAGERRPEGAALRGVLAFRLEEEGVLAPDVDFAIGAERLIDFRDFRRRGDRVADHAAAHAAHNLGYGAVAVDDALHARIFCGHVFPEDRLVASSPRRSIVPLSKGRRRQTRFSGRDGTVGLLSRARVRTPVSSSFSFWSFQPAGSIAPTVGGVNAFSTFVGAQIVAGAPWTQKGGCSRAARPLADLQVSARPRARRAHGPGQSQTTPTDDSVRESSAARFDPAQMERRSHSSEEASGACDSATFTPVAAICHTILKPADFPTPPLPHPPHDRVSDCS